MISADLQQQHDFINQSIIQVLAALKYAPNLQPNSRLHRPTPDNRPKDSEWRFGNKGSLLINVRGARIGWWVDFQTNKNGDTCGLVQVELGLSRKDAFHWCVGVV